jgi:hypothetical protein
VGWTVDSVRELRNAHKFITMAEYRHNAKWDLGVSSGTLLKKNIKGIAT